MNLGGFLGSVFNGAKQAMGNIGNNVQHPMNMVNTVAHPVEQLYNNVFNNKQGVATSAATDYKYTPWFQQFAQNTPITSGAQQHQGNDSSAAFFQHGHGVTLDPSLARQDYTSPDYTVTHELLHAAYDRKTPQAQQMYLQMVNKGISPNQREFLNRELASSLYGNYKLPQDLTTVPRNIATEIHSYLPQSPAFAQNPLSSQLQQYYAHYFNPRAAGATMQYAPDSLKARMVNDSLGGMY